MLFCPNCANLLVISQLTGLNKWVCNSCPYEFPIQGQVRAGIRVCENKTDADGTLRLWCSILQGRVYMRRPRTTCWMPTNGKACRLKVRDFFKI